MWARAPWSSTLLLVTFVRVYCGTRKMLKETETEETIGCFVAFISLLAFQLEGARARDGTGQDFLDPTRPVNSKIIAG